MRDDPARDSEVKELDSRKDFKAFKPFEERDVTKDGCYQMDGSSPSITARWMLAWKMADGENCVEARSAAKGYQDPGLRGGSVDASRCVSLRSSHPQFTYPGAIKELGMWSLGIKELLKLSRSY